MVVLCFIYWFSSAYLAFEGILIYIFWFSSAYLAFEGILISDKPYLIWEGGMCLWYFLIMRQTLLHLVLGICHHKLICGCVLHRSGSLICDTYEHYYCYVTLQLWELGGKLLFVILWKLTLHCMFDCEGEMFGNLILKVSSFDLVIRVIYLLFWRYMLLAPIWSWGVLEFVLKFVLRKWNSKFIWEWKITQAHLCADIHFLYRGSEYLWVLHKYDETLRTECFSTFPAYTVVVFRSLVVVSWHLPS